MKNIFVISFLTFFSLTWSQSSVPFYKGSFDDVLKNAERNEKYFFVDFSTSWCGFCKKMDKLTFTDKKVISYVQKNMIAYKIDAEKGEGPDLARKYQVSGFPTILIFSKSGKLVGRITGYRSGPAFLKELEKHTKKSSEKKLPGVEEYLLAKKNYYDDLLMSMEMKKTEEQRTYEERAKKYGRTRNYFELDELTYELEQKKVTYLPNIKLVFFQEQGHVKKMIDQINLMANEEALTNKELHYYTLLFVEKGKVSLDVLRWANKVAQEDKSLESYDTKAFVQYLYGDTKDAENTLKQLQKMAKKEKKNLPKTSKLLTQILQ